MCKSYWVSYNKLDPPLHAWGPQKRQTKLRAALSCISARCFHGLNSWPPPGHAVGSSYCCAKTLVLGSIIKKGEEKIKVNYLSFLLQVLTAHCIKLVHRLYREVDPQLNPQHVPHMLKKCPDPIPDPKAVQYVRNDRGIPMKRDNNYYRNLLDNKGLMLVDQQLAVHKRTRPYV